METLTWQTSPAANKAAPDRYSSRAEIDFNTILCGLL